MTRAKCGKRDPNESSHRHTDLHSAHTILTLTHRTRRHAHRTHDSWLDDTSLSVFSLSWPHSVEPSWRMPFHPLQDTGRPAACRWKKCSNTSSLSLISSVWDWPSTPPRSRSSYSSWMSRGWVHRDVLSVLSASRDFCWWWWSSTGAICGWVPWSGTFVNRED